MLLTRTLTTMVLGTLVVAGIWHSPHWLFQVLTGVFVLVAAYEWSTLFTKDTLQHRFAFIVLLIVAFLCCYRFFPQLGLWVGLIGWLVAPLWLCAYSKQPRAWMERRSVQVLIALCALVPCWVSLVVLGTQHKEPYLLLVLLFTVWLADISAYLVGKSWGKRKLAPKISPGKTVEGLLGAVVTILLWAIITNFYLPYQISLITWLILLMGVLYFSVIGDLFESVLKRQKGVKDSGSILPGHGGLLDRIDGLLAAAPIFCQAVLLLKL